MPSYTSARSLAADDKAIALEDTVGGIDGLLNSFGSLLFNRREFVADDASATPLDAAVKALTRYNCRKWAASDKSQFSNRVNAGNEEICGLYLDSIGENPGAGDLVQELPNGQCPLGYQAVFSLRRTQDGATTSGTDTVFGPVGRTYVDRGVGGGRRELGVEAFDFSGSPVSKPFLNYPDTDNWVFTAFSVNPFSGNPDNCGSSPFLYLPPPVGTPSTPIPPEITVNIPGIGPVSVTVTFDDEGNPTFCVEELDYCVTIPFRPPGLPPSSPGTPPGPGEPGSPTPTGLGGDAEGEAPDGKELLGLKIDLVEIPEGARTFAPGVYRGVAYVYMGGSEGLDQDYAGSQLSDGQFIYAEREGLTKWRVQANTGYNMSVTPYYRSPAT
jgi:hypothetical protein